MRRYALLLLFPLAAQAAETQSLEKLMTTWLNIESQRGALVTDWNERKQQLEQRASLLEREANVLEKMLQEADQDLSEVDSHRKELTAQQQELENEQDQLESAIRQASIKLSALSARIPPPLQASWQKGLQRIEREDLTLSEKLEQILNLAKQAEQFERRVAIHNDVISIPNGSDAKTLEVTQIYLGLSQGWYVNKSGEYYGYGYADAEGWHWQHMNDQSPDSADVNVNPDQLLKILGMIENPTKAELLTIPVKL